MASLELEARLDSLLSAAQEETKDIDLFAPIAEREECPICLIPLPIKDNEIVFMPCCGKSLCAGCSYKRMETDHNCAFCRQPTLSGTKQIKALKKLMKKNVSGAFMMMGGFYKSGDSGVFQSDTKALELFIRAAELGKPNAYGMIAKHYFDGRVVEQDVSKAIEYWEVATKKGSAGAHEELAVLHR